MLFGRKNASKEKRIAAFVDYEHWYIALENLHSQKPNIAAWFEDLSKHGKIIDVTFFGDFSQPGLRDELGRIRAYSNKIIETRNPSPKFQKDYTDFIMLDNIYQRALASNDIDVYVIFSGDGHFSSVTSFLKNFYNKEVGVYGVTGALSSLLRDTSDWCTEVPGEASKRTHVTDAVLAALKQAQKKRRAIITFNATVAYVAEGTQIDKNEIKSALQWFIENGYIYQKEILVNKKDQVRVLRVNWKKLIEAGLWDA